MLQYFVQESVCSHIPSETQPQLYDMGKSRPEINAYPRIVLKKRMGSHSNKDKGK